MKNRRSHLKWHAANAMLLCSSLPSIAEPLKELDSKKWIQERDEWIDSVTGTKNFGSPSILSKFSDGFFYLRAKLEWNANILPTPIQAPEGFVTDLASIPRAFWSLIPRDGQYADAAIIHDYLYWQQSTTKDLADQILLMAMHDLEVPSTTSQVIYAGVRSVFGEIAWSNNRELRKSGESRQLVRYPDDPKIKWADWKADSKNLRQSK